MKAAIKTEEGWEQVAFPAGSRERMAWLHDHDGREAVVVAGDGTRYCGCEQTLQAYLAQGKQAQPFEALVPILAREMAKEEWDPKREEGYCEDGRPFEGWGGYSFCSGRGECGGKRRFCGAK